MLERRELGKTGIQVTEFCLGVLPMGPLQANLPGEACVEILEKALEEGVNFFDTAETYRTQEYLGEALRGKRESAVISTKSMARDYTEMEKAVEKALRELRTDYIDIFHLHAARALGEVLEEREGALECLHRYREEGTIRAVGVATHSVPAVEAAAACEGIDVVFPLLNRKGLGLLGGSVEEMVEAIHLASRRGKGLYAMKVLGGGNYASTLEEELNWVRQVEGISAVAVGVVSVEELTADLGIFRPGEVDRSKLRSLSHSKQLFIIEKVCRGCGTCIETCPNEALFLKGEKASVDPQRCLLCGYCSPECPLFAIRMV